jgi:hypothetical protein
MTSTATTQSKVSATLSVVVTRADGTVEDLGIVSYWHKNPLKRLAWRATKFLQGK